MQEVNDNKHYSLVFFMKPEKFTLSIGYFTLFIFIVSDYKFNSLPIKILFYIFCYSRIKRDLNFYVIENAITTLDDRKLIH